MTANPPTPRLRRDGGGPPPKGSGAGLGSNGARAAVKQRLTNSIDTGFRKPESGKVRAGQAVMHRHAPRPDPENPPSPKGYGAARSGEPRIVKAPPMPALDPKKSVRDWETFFRSCPNRPPSRQATARQGRTVPANPRR